MSYWNFGSEFGRLSRLASAIPLVELANNDFSLSEVKDSFRAMRGHLESKRVLALSCRANGFKPPFAEQTGSPLLETGSTSYSKRARARAVATSEEKGGGCAIRTTRDLMVNLRD